MKLRSNIILLFLLLIAYSYAQTSRIDSILNAQKAIKTDTGTVNNLIELTWAYQDKGEFEKGIESGEKALKLSEKIKYEIGISDAFNRLAEIYRLKGEYSIALESHYAALQVSEKAYYKRGIARAYKNIGVIYFHLEDYKKALENNLQAVKYFEQIKSAKGISDCKSNIGEIYNKLNESENAFDYYYSALQIKDSLKEERGIAAIQINIGSLLQSQAKLTNGFKRDSLWALSLKHFTSAITICKKIEYKKGVTDAYTHLGNYYLEQRNYNKAKHLLDSGLIIAKEIDSKEYIMNAYEGLMRLHEEQGLFKEALQYYRLFFETRDLLINERNAKKTVQLKMQYVFDKKTELDSVEHAKAQEIKDVEIAKQQGEIKAKRNQQYALFGGLALVLIFAGFMYNRFKVTNSQKQIIEKQKKIVEYQKSLVEEKNREITDSINYAERIQRSFLATKELLDENLTSAGSDKREYFVFFKPKDVVSGDFYWAASTLRPAQGSGLSHPKSAQQLFYLVTADSTGHGVPGAIMSLLNITSLEKAIESYVRPADILNSTRKTIINRLKKDGSKEGGKDGMDCSLCVYDFKNMKLTVAAAHNPVWIVRASTGSAQVASKGSAQVASTCSTSVENVTRSVVEVKPDKMPVGKHDRDHISFTQQEISLQKGDIVYTLTDGFSDQFGGTKGKKFMSKNLRELLVANSHLQMSEQRNVLERTFAQWAGNLEQVDDVCIIGIRI